MSFFQRMSTAKLLVTLAVAVAAVAVAGIAFARGSNEKPPPKPLADAIAGAFSGQLPGGGHRRRQVHQQPAAVRCAGRRPGSRCRARPASCG